MKKIFIILIFIFCISLSFAQSDNASQNQIPSISTNMVSTNANTGGIAQTQISTQKSTLGSMKDIVIEKLSIEDTHTFIVELKNTGKERITRSLYLGFYIDDEIYGVAKRTTTIKGREYFTLRYALPEDKQQKLAEKLIKDDLTLTAKTDPFIKPWEDRDSRSIVLRRQNRAIDSVSEQGNKEKINEQGITAQSKNNNEDNQKLADDPTGAAVASLSEKEISAKESSLSNKQAPVLAQPTQETISSFCRGCLDEEKCIPQGTRIIRDEQPVYCGNGFQAQKKAKETCINSYECLSNICKEEYCLNPEQQKSFFQRILSFFQQLVREK